MEFDAKKGQGASCAIGDGNSYVECAECGATAEIGTVIRAGDVLCEGRIDADSPENAQQKADKLRKIALDACENAKIEISAADGGDGSKLTYRIEFEYSAEKIIFEMKARSVR